MCKHFHPWCGVDGKLCIDCAQEPTGKTDVEALPKREQAISDLQFMRQTHVEWAEHFERHPEIEAQYVATGKWDDAKEHRRIVAMYDNAIACLQALQG